MRCICSNNGGDTEHVDDPEINSSQGCENDPENDTENDTQNNAEQIRQETFRFRQKVSHGSSLSFSLILGMQGISFNRCSRHVKQKKLLWQQQNNSLSRFTFNRRQIDTENWTPSYKKNRVILKRTRRPVAKDPLPFVSTAYSWLQSRFHAQN